MAQCVAVVSGALVESTSDPCTSLVVLTPAEYGALSANPFNLSTDDGVIVAAAVASVWLSAWAFRALRDVLRDRDDGDA